MKHPQDIKLFCLQIEEASLMIRLLIYHRDSLGCRRFIKSIVIVCLLVEEEKGNKSRGGDLFLPNNGPPSLLSTLRWALLHIPCWMGRRFHQLDTQQTIDGTPLYYCSCWSVPHSSFPL